MTPGNTQHASLPPSLLRLPPQDLASKSPLGPSAPISSHTSPFLCLATNAVHSASASPLPHVTPSALPQDPASSINAAVAVACLVGHEEDNARLQLDERLVASMLEVSVFGY